LLWSGTHSDTGLFWEAETVPGEGLPAEAVAALNDLPRSTE